MFCGGEGALEPICNTGLTDEKATLIFYEEFTKESITNLIYRIDNIKQSGSYSRLDLYFSSPGGDVDSMFMLAEYINSIENEDFEIIIKVNGGVCSAGFYILFLLDNVKVEFGESSWGMVHLGTTWLDARSLLDPRQENRSFDKFHKSEMDRLNNLFKELIEKFPLTAKEKKHIYSGNDLHMNKIRLEEIYNEYFMKQDYNHPEMIETYLSLKMQQKQLSDMIENLEEGFKKYGTDETLEDIGLDRE